MYKQKHTKNNEAVFIISKDFYGFGIGIDFVNPMAMRRINFIVKFDFICIRFWWVNYKKLIVRNS